MDTMTMSRQLSRWLALQTASSAASVESPGSPSARHPNPIDRSHGQGGIGGGNHRGKVKKVVRPSVEFGASVVANETGIRAPCRIAWIDPPPALRSKSETTYSCAPPLVSVTPAAARRALVPQIERENLATPPFIAFG